jgi:hypothetical protein
VRESPCDWICKAASSRPLPVATSLSLPLPLPPSPSISLSLSLSKKKKKKKKMKAESGRKIASGWDREEGPPGAIVPEHQDDPPSHGTVTQAGTERRASSRIRLGPPLGGFARARFARLRFRCSRARASCVRRALARKGVNNVLRHPGPSHGSDRAGRTEPGMERALRSPIRFIVTPTVVSWAATEPFVI